MQRTCADFIEMLEFKRLDKDVLAIRKYLEKSEIQFCDISLGTKYMWRDDFLIDYVVVGDTLIMKESCRDYENAFYYPIGCDKEKGLEQIEEYCKQNNLPLLFCCIDNKTAVELSERYNTVKIYNYRDWSDYIYFAESFKTYSGKKLSGQRNHVNKFRRLYPNFSFHEIEEKDFIRIKEFLTLYERDVEKSLWTKIEEEKNVFDLIQNMKNLNQVGGYIEVEGKIVALSVGEVVGDTLIVHIEKGLKGYEGVYPTMAQEFAKAFAGKDVKYINREEDCGDMGLRTSKLQYHPIEVKEKNLVKVDKTIKKIDSPNIVTERLVITDIEKADKEIYAKLYLDDELNKYYGYDYREDLGDNKPTADYFYNFTKGLIEKGEEYDFAVKLNGKMIGEVCLYNFDFFGTAEIGFRFFKDYQGKGYALESVSGLIDYAFNVLRLKKLNARANERNVKSISLLKKVGFKEIGLKNEHFFFEIEK